jgi:hypothetical protein
MEDLVAESSPTTLSLRRLQGNGAYIRADPSREK